MLGQEDSPKPPFIQSQSLKSRNQNRSTVVAQHGMVCASQPLAAMVGIDILKKGGSCIDAAIATNAMLGLTEPASNGIGGDLFAIVWSEQDQKLFGLNASGRSPYAWNLEEAKKRGLDRIPRNSPLSWTVPGCVSGWGQLHAKFGKLAWADLLSPAIEYAANGFPLSPIIAGHFQFDPNESPTLTALYHPEGKPPQYGQIFRNSLLANTYREIARGGWKAFYEGKTANLIVAKSHELGGLMQKKDLADHTADWVEPVSSSYRGWDVWEIPPNGQGICALQILNLLENFEIATLQPNSAEHLHLFAEAKKLAFEDRARYYADPRFADVPVEWLISKEYARRRAKLISPEKANSNIQPGDPKLDDDTVYLTAADAQGNMVSFIQSVYNGFGSMICPDEVGFHMQNRGQAFSLDPNHRNKLEPHKRPFHTIIPAFLTKDGAPVMSFGVMGGDFQPQGHAQVIMNMIDFHMSPQQAGEQARLAHDGSSRPWGDTLENGGELVFESGISDSVRARLAELGHRIRPGISAHGGYQAIWREDNPLRYFGGSDPRKDGAALGF
ncbi:MAG: gamma-glutamyltransferase [Planctomycetales bacterium]|nr:gamma-glutamyltransferase [Planctomycetales bacterium]